MERFLLVCLFVFAPAFLMVACGSSSGRTVRVLEKDNGKEIELNEGDSLEIVLGGNPTTGYRWVVTGPESGVLRRSAEPDYEPESEKIGAGGMYTFRFKAAAPGTTAVKLIYSRPWEKNTLPANAFEVPVLVTEK